MAIEKPQLDSSGPLFLGNIEEQSFQKHPRKYWPTMTYYTGDTEESLQKTASMCFDI